MLTSGRCFLRLVCGWAETSAAEISCNRGERTFRTLQQAMALVDTPACSTILEHEAQALLQVARWMATEPRVATMWQKKW